MNLTDLYYLLLTGGWSRDTAYKGDFRPGLPEWGQCGVTAMLIQDKLGGDIIRSVVTDKGLVHQHYYNRLLHGATIDLTARQFTPGAIHLELGVRHREELDANEDTAKRYRALKLNLLSRGTK